MTSLPPGSPSQGPNPLLSQRSWILLVSYAVLTLLVLGVAIFLATRTRAPIQTFTPLPPFHTSTPSTTPSPSPTATLTPTERPTFTPRPSSTPTITPTPSNTPTPTPPPSLTPAFPRSENDLYHLVDWTPELADYLIQLLEAYPDTLSAFARGEDNAGYYAAFSYAIQAQREALLRFPSASQASNWQWRLAYNLARTGDPKAGVLYTQLITDELNNQPLRLDELPEVGISQKPPIIIEVIPLQPIPGYLSNSLVKVAMEGKGGAFIWLLETPNNFASYPLTSDFDFLHDTGVNYFTGDLTGDGSVEVVIYRTAIPGSFRYVLPRIFSLSQRPPQELFFEYHQLPEIGPDFRNQWAPGEKDTIGADLQFEDTLFPPCPLTVHHNYRWNGRAFAYLSAGYEVDPHPELLSYCSVVIDHAIRVWGPKATISLMETILPIWPPDRTVDGDLLPKSALDEWRYRLGLYYALTGDVINPSGYIRGITINPAEPGSEWISPAVEFLKVFQDRKDIYRACQLSPFCDPRLAFQALVDSFSPEDFTAAPLMLQEAGITTRSSGFFDFDNDGITERWVVLRHKPNEKLEFWILVQTSSSVKALFVDFVEFNLPQVSYVEPLGDPPIVRLDQGITFVLERRDNLQEPFITFVQPEREFSVDLTRQTLDQIESALLSGDDPSELREELLDMQASPFFTCNVFICPRFLYDLGLANELAGNERQAVDAYLDIWRRYPRSPYATVARIKLAGLPLPPTSTPTPTPTNTPTSTFTPTVTGTLPTATPTETPTSTTTVTPTSTSTTTITPSPSPSTTPSLTLTLTS